MTKTEKAQAAWEMLQSKEGIYTIMNENECKADEIEAASNRLLECSKARSEKIKKEKIDNIIQQLQIAGIDKDHRQDLKG